MQIRIGEVGDAERISQLFLALVEEFITHEFGTTGRSRLLQELAAPAIAERFAGPVRFYLAEDGEALAGAAAVRDGTHLLYLFVAKSHHGRGIARALWSRIQADYLSPPVGTSRMTVNASNFAVPAYERLGFRRCGGSQERAGVIYNPMEFRVDQ